MKGRERYYQRELELNKIGYIAVLFMRHCFCEDSKKTKELCEYLVKDNLEKHEHSDHFDEIAKIIDEDLLKLATKRFAYRIFDLPLVLQEKARKEKEKKELAKKREKEEVRKRVEAFRNKKYIVKIRKTN